MAKVRAGLGFVEWYQNVNALDVMQVASHQGQVTQVQGNAHLFSFDRGDDNDPNNDDQYEFPAGKLPPRETIAAYFVYRARMDRKGFDPGEFEAPPRGLDDD